MHPFWPFMNGYKVNFTLTVNVDTLNGNVSSVHAMKTYDSVDGNSYHWTLHSQLISLKSWSLYLRHLKKTILVVSHSQFEPSGGEKIRYSCHEL